MFTDSNMTWKNYCFISAVGGLRGVAVESLLFPLEVVKVQQQAAMRNQSVHAIAKTLFQSEGWRAFYRGLPPQLGRTVFKQAWFWPVVIGLPEYMKRNSFYFATHPLLCQSLTGFTFSTLSASLSPLEKLKMLSITSRETTLQTLRRVGMRQFFKEGWQGFPYLWVRVSVATSSFLMFQDMYRRTYKQITGREQLNLAETSCIASVIAFSVLGVMMPFDVANTVVQSRQFSKRETTSIKPGVIFASLLKQGKLYRGWRVNLASLIVHNIASVTLIEKYPVFLRYFFPNGNEA